MRGRFCFFVRFDLDGTDEEAVFGDGCLSSELLANGIEFFLCPVPVTDLRYELETREGEVGVLAHFVVVIDESRNALGVSPVSIDVDRQ